MAYQSQLVVRTRDPQRAEIIDKVKELAGEEGKTYSEMAIELLERGLGAGDAQPAKPAELAPEPVRAEASDESDASEKLDDSGGVDEKAADGGSPTTTPAPKPPPEKEEKAAQPEEPLPDVDLPEDRSVEAVAAACVEYLETDGRRAATHLLAKFFATAGPADGGHVKDALQSKLGDDEYDAILEGLRNTEQYREYRQRVIFGS
ncbi:MAG: hypothetical protein ACOC9J_01335 [Persicimonas sp.]